MQMSAPFFAVCESALKMVASSTISTFGIGHEQLEAGDAFAHHVVHVFEAGVAQIGDDHVQAVVDAGLAFGLLPPGVERVAHLRAARLDGEIDDGGGAAERRGARAGFEIVG